MLSVVGHCCGMWREGEGGGQHCPSHTHCLVGAPSVISHAPHSSSLSIIVCGRWARWARASSSSSIHHILALLSVITWGWGHLHLHLGQTAWEGRCPQGSYCPIIHPPCPHIISSSSSSGGDVAVVVVVGPHWLSLLHCCCLVKALLMWLVL